MPRNLRDSKKDDFMVLEIGSMSLAAYESKFRVFFRYATQLLTIEEERVRLFIKRLNFECR